MHSKKFILSIIIFILFLVTFFSGCIDEFESISSFEDNGKNNSFDSLSIACWNLKIYGKSKASNETLLSYYKEKLENFDVFIIQEIRDVSGDAILKFSEKFPNHNYIISTRAGQSYSKEQYAVFYNERVSLNNYYDYTLEYQSKMQRPPFMISFSSINWSFSILTSHTDPDEVDGELDIIQDIAYNLTGDIIIIGDLNADGSFYNEDEILHFTDWHWVISNDLDTTVASSDNTYDRIILNDNAFNNFNNYGIMNDVKKSQSDHYMIFAEFNPNIS